MIEQKEKYINPFTDFGFKKLFGTEINKDLLMDFLNELIPNHGKIIELNYIHPEQLGRSESDRNAVFDIHCKTASGEYFIVEMQKAYQKYFKDRSVYYASFPIQNQGVKGGWNFELKAVYTVGILNFVFNEEEPNYYHTEVKLMDTVKKTVFYDKLTFIYLEMPKFNKTLEELETHFDKWLFVLKHLPTLQEMPKSLQERIFKKIFKVAEIAKMTKEEHAEYEHNWKRINDYKNTIDTAREEGEAKGKAEGKAEGLAEGELKGKINIAKTMLSKGKDLEEIVEMTELTIEQINQLKENK